MSCDGSGRAASSSSQPAGTQARRQQRDIVQLNEPQRARAHVTRRVQQQMHHQERMSGIGVEPGMGGVRKQVTA